MKYTIKYNYTFDFYDFIISYLTQSYQSDLKAKIMTKYQDEVHVDNLEKMYSLMDSVFDKNDSEYIRLFETLFINGDVEHSINLASLIVTLNRENGQRELMSTLGHTFSEEFKDMDHLIRFMQSSQDIKIELKYYIQFATSNLDILTSELQEYLKPFYKLEQEITDLASPIIEGMIDKLNDEYIMGVLNEMKFDISDSHEMVVSPSFVLVNALNMTQMDDGVLYVQWGCFAFKALDATLDHDVKEKRFLEISKILSEQTKLDIFKFCLDEERYGSEIAKFIDISSATVSHHMSQLSSLNYVTIRLDKRRVYYKTNRQKILEDLNYITKLLAEDTK